MTNGVILALDQGTTSSRAMAIAFDGSIVASAQEEFPQIFPQSGWVEHDPEAIWRTQRRTAQQTLERLGSRKVAAIGVTNQRETVVVWDRKTGEAIHNAIVWQDRRTAQRTQELAAAGHQDMVGERVLWNVGRALELIDALQHLHRRRRIIVGAVVVVVVVVVEQLVKVTKGKKLVAAAESVSASRVVKCHFTDVYQKWASLMLHSRLITQY